MLVDVQVKLTFVAIVEIWLYKKKFIEHYYAE